MRPFPIYPSTPARSPASPALRGRWVRLLARLPMLPMLARPQRPWLPPAPLLWTALWALAFLAAPLFPGNALFPGITLFPGIAMAERSSIRPGENNLAHRRGGGVVGGRRGAASSSLPGLLPGEEITLGKCLRFSVRGISDRSGALAHADWVNVRVRNQCPNLRRHLLVALVLIDAQGASYGGPVWLLQRGEILPPGGSKTGNFPLPDPGDRMPVRWAARLLKVQRPRPTGASSPQVASTQVSSRQASSTSRVHAPRVAAGRSARRLTIPVRLKKPSRAAPPVQDKNVRMSPSALPFVVKSNRGKSNQTKARQAAVQAAPKSRQGKQTLAHSRRITPARPGRQRPAKKKWWQ